MTDNELFLYIKKMTDYKVTGLDFDYKVEIDESTKEIRLIFKESDSELDWRINLDFFPSWIKFGRKIFVAHRGYIYAYLSARDEVIKDLFHAAQDKPDFKLCIYGWSLGSAVAGLAMADLYESYKYRSSKLITFGSVKMWYFPGKKYLAKMADEIKEYTTVNDFVTWQAPVCHRIHKVEKGDKFSFKKILKTPYWHCNYNEFI